MYVCILYLDKIKLCYLLDVPIQPIITGEFNVTSSSITLQWEEPLINNAPIQYYEITYTNPPFVDDTTTVINTTNTTLVIDHLFPGIEYAFAVVAVNEIGRSRASNGRLVRTLEEGIVIKSILSCL